MMIYFLHLGLHGITYAFSCGVLLSVVMPFGPDSAADEGDLPIAPQRRLRVAVLTQHFPSSDVPWRGQAAYQTLRWLAQRCDVHVFYPESTYFRFLPPKSGHKEAIDRNWSPPGVSVTYIPYAALPLISRALNGFVISQRLKPYIRRYKPDIIFSYTIYPDGYAAVRVAKALGVPAVVKAVGSDLNRIPDSLCLRLTRTTLRKADFVSAVSHDLCNTARKLGANEERSNANLSGCDTEIFYDRDARACRQELGIATEGEVMVYLGRLDYRKGLIELVDAVSQLTATRPGLRCYLVGDGPDRPQVIEAIARNKAEQNVILIPPCSTEKAAIWMGAATLVTLPSYAEGCPNLVVEALASGRPVVATRVGGIPELLSDESGRLVPAKDAPALQKALDEVLSQAWDSEDIVMKHHRSWKDVSDQCYDMLVSVRARFEEESTADISMPTGRS